MTIKMVVTDLDGTLLRDDKSIGYTDRNAFEKLGEKGIIRVAATGRSLYSISKVVPKKFPFDFIVFSTGSGVIDYNSHKLLIHNGLAAEQTEKVIKLFREEKLDFTVHFPIPNNHKFYYHQVNSNNIEFSNYCDFYRGHCTPADFSKPIFENACQLLSIMEDDIDRFNSVKSKLTDFKVIRTTSPIEHTTIWMEVFPPNVSKGDAVHWLCSKLKINKDQVLAIGNDYNDVDFLDYAGHARLVENGHPELKERYQIVPSNNSNGVSKAIQSLVEI